ncbi:MAG: hypothetical protein V4585_14880 [Bacteroidota bacterium]
MTAILKNWDFMRILRLGMGLWIIYSSFTDRQPLIGLLGTFFVYQAIMNVGCCGSGGCSIPTAKIDDKNQLKDVDYEEVK